jgi:hypothetical protein
MNAEVPPVFAGTAKTVRLVADPLTEGKKKPTLVRSKEPLKINYYLLSINY